MSIPKMTNDLAIIQKLSDLPNATDGLTAAELKAKFDEAALAIQKWLNEELTPAIKASQIPFTASSEIDAENVDAAIREVHNQIREAASGTIVNGSVTKSKLSTDLLARVFGGRPWVSVNTPGPEQNTNADFPIGQIWLRPAFTVTNAAGSTWTASGCKVAVKENRFTITGDGSVKTATVTQTIENLGNAGDRVYVLFGTANKDVEITGMTVNLDGGEEQDVSAGVFSGTLVSKRLTVKISVTWPATSLAGGSVDIVNYTVVNVDAILRQTAGAEDMADWPGYISGLLPLSYYNSPAEIYIQTLNGTWWPMVAAVLPVERGGLGINEVSPGDLFYGAEGNKLTRLPKPAVDNCVLQYVDGKVQWVDAAQVRINLGVNRRNVGSYTGTGYPRNIDLTVVPEELVVTGSDGSSWVFRQGTEYSERVQASGGYTAYTSGATLQGKFLEIWTTANDAQLIAGGGTTIANKSNVTYQWTAIY